MNSVGSSCSKQSAAFSWILEVKKKKNVRVKECKQNRCKDASGDKHKAERLQSEVKRCLLEMRWRMYSCMTPDTGAERRRCGGK